MAALKRARMLVDAPAHGLRCGDIAAGSARQIKALGPAADANTAAVAYALAGGARVVELAPDAAEGAAPPAGEGAASSASEAADSEGGDPDPAAPAAADPPATPGA